MATKPPYFKLSLFYFFYFSALGSFVPYWSVYLKYLQFSAVEIGQLLAVFMVSKLISPFALGWLADLKGSRIHWVRISSLLAVFGLIPIYIEQSYEWVALSLALFGFFWNASLPQFEAITLNHLEDQSSRYSWVRLWGSIGFITAVVCLPLLFERTSIEVLPMVMLVIFIAIWLSTWLVKDKEHHIQHHESPELLRVMKHPMVIALFVACILQSISHGAYYTFFSIYLDEHGYSRLFTGWMWALGVIAEVVLFIFLYRLFDKYKAYQLFAASLLLTSMRWVLLGHFVDNTFILLLSQLLHAASFGLFHASAIHLIHDWFPGRLQGRGQALYAGLSFGLGGAIGSMLSGYLWDFSTTTITFMVMAASAFMGWLLFIRIIRSSELWNA